MSQPQAKGCRAMGFPPPEVARLHSHHKAICCPECKKRWRDCRCKLTQQELDNLSNKPHLAREWGYKGAMVLPVTHPDHPLFRSNQ